MAYQPVSAIEVHCWGMRVGVVALDPARGYYAFEYYPDFRKRGIELSPLLLPSKTAGAVLATELPEATYHRLPAFIADSLPDKFGNALIDAWMARSGLLKSDFTVLDRLAYVGSRAMGALEFAPALPNVTSRRSSALEVKDIVETARKALALNTEELAKDSSAALAQLMQIGTSAGGAKAKAIVGYCPETGTMISGQFPLADGYEPWLLKVDTSENRPFGLIEYAYSLAAKACGVDMADCALMEIDGKNHFMTKRFDRAEGNEKLHMQTLCAMAGMDYNLLGTHDYAQLFQVAKRLELGGKAADQIFLRMAFNVCFANNDDHPKNHSFLLGQNGSWKLAPAYDLIHASNPDNRWLARHAMGVQGKFEGITRKDILKTGKQANVRNPEKLLDSVLDAAGSWIEFAQRASMPTSETDLIGKSIATCADLLR